MISRIYAKQSKRITFSHRITSPVNQGAQLCQTDPKLHILVSSVF